MRVELSSGYRLLPFLYAAGGLTYSLLPVRSETAELVNLLSVGLGPRLDFQVLQNLSLGAYARGGFFYGFLSGADPSGSGNAFLEGGAYAAYRLFPYLSLGVDASYRAFAGFATDMSLSLVASYHWYYSSPSILELSQPELRVLPILYMYYSRNPLAAISVRNATDQPVTDVLIRFFAPQFMVEAGTCSSPFLLAPHEERSIAIRPLLTEKVLTISEGTEVSAMIWADFTFKGKRYRKEVMAPLEVASRNAIVWDDSRKAACFVTAKDPAVLRFAKNFAALLRGRSVPAFGDALLRAMILHEAISAYGLAYALDPVTPYASFSKDRTALDFLQFPYQTLEYRGGDCDDLSVLYSALLESLGIESAFITVPGHILVAFRLEGDQRAALSGLHSRNDFIVRGESIWVPVETTSLEGGFLRAWRLGAQCWSDAMAKDTAGFFPVHEAWELYPAVGFAGPEAAISLPDGSAVLSAFQEELDALTKRETENAISALRARIAQNPEDPALRNSLGVLYGRFGMYDQALRVLGEIQQRDGYFPALVNTAHIYFLTEEYPKAEQWYQKALEKQRGSSRVLLALIKVERALQNTERASALYQRLKELDPELATQVEGLAATAGAADRSDRAEAPWRRLQWEE